MFWISVSEDIESPEIGSKQQGVREEQLREQMVFTLDYHSAILVFLVYWLKGWENL